MLFSTKIVRQGTPVPVSGDVLPFRQPGEMIVRPDAAGYKWTSSEQRGAE